MADLSVSLFAADILHIEEELRSLDGLSVFSLHADIMDGHFVPLFGFNRLWLQRIQEIWRKGLDIHFMTDVTDEMLQSYMQLKPKRISIHAEANEPKRVKQLLGQIRKMGVEAGIALSPETDPETVIPYLGLLDDILIMSAQPGQEHSVFLETTYKKIAYVRKILKEKQAAAGISVDGGVNKESAEQCILNGADRIVMGRALFQKK